MEHSVCKVSLAHHTKEWLSALFEALDGLELSVNNYLFTLLWIACRNKRLSHHLYQRSPPSSLHVTTYYGAQNEGTGNGDTVCDRVRRLSEHACLYIVSRVDEEGVLSRFCLLVFLELTCLFHKLKQAAQLSGESSPWNRCCIWVKLLGLTFCLSLSNYSSKASRERFSLSK